MAKREILETTITQRAEILSKIAELDNMVVAYFGQYHKMTPGQQSIGEASLPFLEKCVGKIEMYPEILSSTFNKEDFNDKASGVADFMAFKQKLTEAINKWDSNAKICKSDAMYYANEYYSIIQKEAGRNTRYKPTLDELTSFYKKSKPEKPAAQKGTVAPSTN
jgi:hypothetical protein